MATTASSAALDEDLDENGNPVAQADGEAVSSGAAEAGTGSVPGVSGTAPATGASSPWTNIQTFAAANPNAGVATGNAINADVDAVTGAETTASNTSADTAEQSASDITSAADLFGGGNSNALNQLIQNGSTTGANGQTWSADDFYSSFGGLTAPTDYSYGLSSDFTSKEGTVGDDSAYQTLVSDTNQTLAGRGLTPGESLLEQSVAATNQKTAQDRAKDAFKNIRSAIEARTGTANQKIKDASGKLAQAKTDVSTQLGQNLDALNNEANTTYQNYLTSEGLANAANVASVAAQNQAAMDAYNTQANEWANSQIGQRPTSWTDDVGGVLEDIFTLGTGTHDQDADKAYHDQQMKINLDKYHAAHPFVAGRNTYGGGEVTNKAQTLSDPKRAAYNNIMNLLGRNPEQVSAAKKGSASSAITQPTKNRLISTIGGGR